MLVHRHSCGGTKYARDRDGKTGHAQRGTAQEAEFGNGLLDGASGRPEE
jgi:hypothetical protein